MRSKKNLKVLCSKHTTNIWCSSAGNIDPQGVTGNPDFNSKFTNTFATLLDFFPLLLLDF